MGNGNGPRFKLRPHVLTAVVCAAAVAMSTLPATAGPHDDKSKVDREIAALRDQLDNTSADLVDAFVALRRTEAALPAARSALSLATTQQADAERRNDELTIALLVARAREAGAVEKSQRSQRDIAAARRQVGQFAARLYQEQGMGQLEVALNATTPEDFVNRIALADTVSALQQRSIGRLSTLKAAAAASEAHIAALRREVAAASVRAARALAAANSAKAAALAAKSRLDSLAVEQARQAAVVETKKAGEQRRLGALQAESDRLAKVLAARARAAKAAAAKARAAAEKARAKREAAARAAAARAHKPYVPERKPPSTPNRSGGFLSAPSGGYISSEFGMRFHPILKYWRLHAGRDYAAACGQPVVAAAPGTIVSAGWAGDYGNRVVIDLGIQRGVSLATTYNHMSAIARTSGSVARGEVIGFIGTTGASTGCHLHFETREEGTPVDPRKWL